MNRDEIIHKGRMKIHSMEEPSPQPTTSSQEQANGNHHRYQQLELISEGSIGQVFKAYDSVLKRTVALKSLRIPHAGMENRFLREAQAQASVPHPNICEVYKVGEIKNQPYAMQYFFPENIHLKEAAL